MSKDHSHSPRKSQKKWMFFLLLLGVTVLLHKPLILVGCKIALKSAFPHFSCESIDWEGGGIVVRGFKNGNLKTLVHVDKIGLIPEGGLFPFRLKIVLTQPHIQCSSAHSDPLIPLPFFYQNSFFSPRWEVNDGVISLPSGEEYRCNMIPGEEKDEIGMLTFLSKKRGLVLETLMRIEEQRVRCHFQLEDSELSKLLPLAAFAYPPFDQQWEKVSGTVDLKGDCLVDTSLQILSLNFSGSLRHIALVSPAIGIDLECEECTGQFAFPVSEKETFWGDRCKADFLLQEGNLLLDAPLVQSSLGVKHLSGALRLEPSEEPHLAVKGTVLMERQELFVSLSGKGDIQEDDTFWSVIECQCTSPSGQSAQALLSLCRPEVSQDVVQLKIDKASHEHLDFLRSFLKLSGQCVEGSAEIALTCLFELGVCKQMTVDHCAIDDLRLVFQEEEGKAYLERAVGSGTLIRSFDEEWRWETLHLDLSNGSYSSSDCQLSEVNGDLNMDEGEFGPSHIQGNWDHLFVDGNFLKQGEAPTVRVKASGAKNPLIEKLWPQIAESSCPFDLEAEAVVSQGMMDLDVQGNIGGDLLQAKLLFAVSPEFLVKELSSFEFLKGEAQIPALSAVNYSSSLAAWIPGLHLSGRLSCQALFSPSNLQLKIGGEEVLIQHPQLELNIPSLHPHPAELSYDWKGGRWAGTVPLFDAKAYFPQSYVPLERIDATFVLKEGVFQSRGFYAESEGLAIRGDAEFTLKENGELGIGLFTSQITGNVHSLFSCLEKVSQGAFSYKNPLLSGRFYSENQGFFLNAQVGSSGCSAEWGLKGGFQHISFPLNGSTDLTDGSCEFSFNSATHQLTVQKGKGRWQLKNGKSFAVHLKRLELSFIEVPTLDAFLTVMDGKREVACFECEGKRTSSLWGIAFNQRSTHFGGVPLNISECFIDGGKGTVSLHMAPTLQCSDLAGQVMLLQNVGILSERVSPAHLQQWQLEGTVQTHLSSRDITLGFSFQAESQDLKVKGNPWPGFRLNGEKNGDHWVIEKFEGEGIFLKGALLVDANGLTISKFDGCWKGIQGSGHGYFREEQKKFFCQLEKIDGELTSLSAIPGCEALKSAKGSFKGRGDLQGDYSNLTGSLEVNGEVLVSADVRAPLPVSFVVEKPMKYHFSSGSGIVFNEVEVQCRPRIGMEVLGMAKVKTLHLGLEGELACQGLQCTVDSRLFSHLVDKGFLPPIASKIEFDEKLGVSGELSFTKKGTIFQGNLNPGVYGISGKKVSFPLLQLRYEKDQILFKGKTYLQELPLWTSLQIDLKKDPCGVCKFYDDPRKEGLKVFFSTQSGQVFWENVQGSCYGITCSLVKSQKRKVPLATVLTGEIQIDATAFPDLLPKEMKERLLSLKLGKGYGWKGDIVLWHELDRGFQMTGAISGSDFELFGYCLKRLEGELDASHDHVHLSNIRIEDGAGAIGVKRLSLKKQAAWSLSIPQVVVRQLQPSLLRRVGGGISSVKPFTIQDLILKDIRCFLGDKGSLEASGRLTFTNVCKKEQSILDFPLELIKKFGLDPGMLTPIQGEIDLELRGDRFYLLSLRHAFSEGNRSEFYLAPSVDLSYIDLEGRMHIDLKLYQDVVLKLMEPFTLTIRGTLDKPRYGLEY